MSFSHVAPAYLAAGFEKSRGQYSLHVWDVERVARTLAGPPPRSDDPTVVAYQPQGSLQPEDGTDWTSSAGSSRLSQTRTLSSSASTAATDGSGSIRRYAFGEAVPSVTFLPDHPHMLCVGTGLRSLRFYDIRKSRESATDVETQAVYGVCFDPFNSMRMASFGEDGVVEFWDARKIPKPVLSLHAAIVEDNDPHGKRSLSHIAFSPVRHGLFGTLAHESRYIRLWTLVGPTAEPSSAETVTARIARPTSVNENASDYIAAKVEGGSASNISLVVGGMRAGDLVSFPRILAQ
jgi:WD40 repeat protein